MTDPLNLELAHEVYEQLLKQRLLAEACVQKRSTAKWLDEHADGWRAPITAQDLAHAFTSTDPNLHQAFELWWNDRDCSPVRLTWQELQLRLVLGD